MIYIFIFFLGLLILFFSSNFLIKSLAGFFFRLTKSHKATVHILAYIFLPGTLIHELSHVLAAGMLLVPVGNFEVLPEIRENDVKLGSAQIGKTDPLRRAFIGVAPVIFGMAVILSVLYYLTTASVVEFWVFVTLVYVIFVTSNTMFSSKKDLEGTLEVGAMVIGLFIAFYLLKFNAFFSWAAEFVRLNERFIQKADQFLWVCVVLNMAIYFLFELVNLSLRKKN